VWGADMLPSPQGTVTLRKADALQDLFYRPIVESIGKLQEITNKLPMPPTLLMPV